MIEAVQRIERAGSSQGRCVAGTSREVYLRTFPVEGGSMPDTEVVAHTHWAVAIAAAPVAVVVDRGRHRRQPADAEDGEEDSHAAAE